MTPVRGLARLLSSLPASVGSTASEEVSSGGPTGGETAELTPREESALRRTETVATLLDDAFGVPGTNYRVGLDPILGVLPVGGDAVAGALSLYPVFEAYRFGAGKLTLAKMLFVIGVDAVVGSIPILGTLFDAVWKANRRNHRTLEAHIESG